jgi:hypothetical protein
MAGLLGSTFFKKVSFYLACYWINLKQADVNRAVKAGPSQQNPTPPKNHRIGFCLKF